MEVIFRHGSGRPTGEWISFLGRVLVGLPMVADCSLLSLGHKRRRCSSHTPATRYPPPLAKASTRFPTTTQTPTSSSSSARRAHVSTRKVGSEEQVLGKFHFVVLVSGRWCWLIVLLCCQRQPLMPSKDQIRTFTTNSIIRFLVSASGGRRGDTSFCAKSKFLCFVHTFVETYADLWLYTAATLRTRFGVILFQCRRARFHTT
jgi:hypothetical protein